VLGGSRGTVRCYCLTLNRAGEDGAAFDLTVGQRWVWGLGCGM